MPKRKNNKGADYEYVGTAKKDNRLDTEYAAETTVSPGVRKIEPKAKPKGQC